MIAAVAHHEAGHAVANFFHQVRFLRVTIEPGNGSDGRIHLRKNRLRLNRHLAERKAVCLLAGPAAQRRFNPRSVRSYHAGSDHEQVVDWALVAGGSTEVINARVKLWEALAADLIEARWPLVEKVAAALIERRTLTEDEVTALILPPRLPAPPFSCRATSILRRPDFVR